MALNSRLVRCVLGGLLGTALCAVVAVPSAVASRGQSFASATGDVFLANPNQELVFNAFAGKTAGSLGSVTYANFDAGLSYSASVTSAVVDPAEHLACFTYVIPPGNFVSGIEVTWKVVDGGTPGTNGDTAGYVFGTPGSYGVPSSSRACADLGVTNYAITGGNLVVH